MTTQEKLKHCAGCRDDFYNQPGNSGSKTGLCWMLPTMKLVKRKPVAIDERPPWTAKPVLKPDCYHKKGFVYVKPDQTR